MPFISIFSPVVIFAVCLPIIRLVKGEWPDLHLLGQANYLPYLGCAILPVWLVTFGFGEEIGWRGFALPRLQKTMSASKAGQDIIPIIMSALVITGALWIANT